jgi:hypothetical protein
MYSKVKQQAANQQYMFCTVVVASEMLTGSSFVSTKSQHGTEGVLPSVQHVVLESTCTQSTNIHESIHIFSCENDISRFIIKLLPCHKILLFLSV